MAGDNKLQLKVGNATEKFIAKTLKGYGYWVYNMPVKTSGQPCDLVAVKGEGNGYYKAWLIDAKHVRENEVSFPFSRIEPNQFASMNYALNFAKINNVGFAIFFERDKHLYWLSYELVKQLQGEGAKSVNMAKLETLEEVL